jgi:hypothetical protein
VPTGAARSRFTGEGGVEAAATDHGLAAPEMVSRGTVHKADVAVCRISAAPAPEVSKEPRLADESKSRNSAGERENLLLADASQE